MKNDIFTIKEQEFLIKNSFVKISIYSFEFRGLRNPKYGTILTKDESDGRYITSFELIVYDNNDNPRLEKYSIKHEDYSLENLIADIKDYIEL